MINAGLIGYGKWGPNLLRNFLQNSHFNLTAIAEKNQQKRKNIHRLYPQLKVYNQGLELIADNSIDAVAIACPVKWHYPLAKKALESGKQVLVEKPIAATPDQASELIDLAARKKLTLMVDHTLLFDDAVKKIKNLHDAGELGDVSYFDATRVNLGGFQPDVSVLWDLGPHDLAVMDYLFNEEPLNINATGYCHLNANCNDLAYLTLHFKSNRIAHFKFSWVWPVKQRQTVIGGSKKTIVWDDTALDEKLKVYHRGIAITDQAMNQESYDTPIIMPDYYRKEVYAPPLEQVGALAGVLDHFAKVIASEEKSLMDGVKGLRILNILAAAEAQINQNLKKMPPPLRSKFKR